MSVTVFSFTMAVLWSTLLFLIAFLLRRQGWFVQSYGVAFLLALYAGITIRTILPVELLFTKVVSSSLYNNIYSAVTEGQNVSGFHINLLTVLLIIWVSIAVLLLFVFIFKYRMGLQKLRKIEKHQDPKVKELLIDISDGFAKNVHVHISKEISIPMAFGLIQQQILLPDRAYNDTELQQILLHEYTHLRNHDMWMKLLLELMCCFFWWNPFIYLLKMDLNKVLEIKCDLAITGEMKNKEKAAYLSAIRDVLSEGTEQGGFRVERQIVTAEIVDGKYPNFTEERFHLVSNYKKNKRKEKAFHLIAVCALGIMLIASYSFVFQPKFDVPSEDIIEDGQAYEVTSENSYVLQKRDGSYVLFDMYGEETPMDETGVEIYRTIGFQIIKE